MIISSLYFRMATMHVVATNIILWFRTLIKESIEEIWEYEESSTHHFKVHHTNFFSQTIFFSNLIQLLHYELQLSKIIKFQLW